MGTLLHKQLDRLGYVAQPAIIVTRYILLTDKNEKLKTKDTEIPCYPPDKCDTNIKGSAENGHSHQQNV